MYTGHCTSEGTMVSKADGLLVFGVWCGKLALTTQIRVKYVTLVKDLEERNMNPERIRWAGQKRWSKESN